MSKKIKTGTIEITLVSDLIPGSGTGFSNTVDNDIIFDEYGFPYIPARRIRGILKEAANEYGQLDPSKKSLEEHLFGERSEDTHFVLNNAVLRNLDSYYQEIESLKPEFRSYVNINNVLEYYTILRNQTRIDDNGIAVDNTLRTSRAIARGNKFYAHVEFFEDDEDDIRKCFKLVRHLGMSRTRGFGEIKIKLFENKEDGNLHSMPLDQMKDNIEYEIKLMVTNTSQLAILGSEGEKIKDYIPGASVLGYFANLYTRDDTKDQNKFNELFLNGNIQFKNGYISDSKWREYYPVRNSMYKQKTEDIYYDMSYSKDQPDNIIIQTVRNKYVTYTDQDTFLIKEVNKEMVYHHRRPKDKSIGHVVSNEDDLGFFYQNEAVFANQRFIIPIQGKGKYLKEALPKELSYLQIGRSKYTQYGNIKVNDIQFREVSESILKEGTDVIVTLLSPALFIDKQCQSNLNIDDLMQQLGLKVDETNPLIFVDYTRIGGYNAKWKLQKPSYIGFNGGCTFRGILTKDTPSYYAIGDEINEGFGQVWVQKVPANITNQPQVIKEQRIPGDKTPILTKAIVKAGIQNQQHKEFIDWMYNQSNSSLTSSSVGRILSMLATKNWDAFIKEIGVIADKDKRKEVERQIKRITKQCDQIIDDSLICELLDQSELPNYKKQFYLDNCKYYFVHEKMKRRTEE